MIELGVNIDHVATLRNARGDFFPSLVYAASIAEQNGGDFITCHLREDRRHIKDDDVSLLVNNVTTYVNLEMACNEDVLNKAIQAKPYKVTLVPERREEVTTEGGLDIVSNEARVSEYVKSLKDNGIKVSLFVEHDIKNIDTVVRIGADEVEIHTGAYSLASLEEKEPLIQSIEDYSRAAVQAGLRVCAGHGLEYHNVKRICEIKEIVELNIGYSIVTRSIFTGLASAVKEMRDIIDSFEK